MTLKVLAVILLAIIGVATLIALYEGVIQPLIQPLLERKQKT